MPLAPQTFARFDRLSVRSAYVRLEPAIETFATLRVEAEPGVPVRFEPFDLPQGVTITKHKENEFRGRKEALFLVRASELTPPGRYRLQVRITLAGQEGIGTIVADVVKPE